jgi:hypothetical protein
MTKEVDELDGMLPDLHAGDLSAMGRLLERMSGGLSRAAVLRVDMMGECKRVAIELEDLAGQSPGTEGSQKMIDMAMRLRAVVKKNT